MKPIEDANQEEAGLKEPGQALPSESMAGGRNHAGQQIARATGTVMIAFIVVSLVGVVQQMVMTRVFGMSADLDSYYAANRITELLFNLMAGGALGSAFIPMFTGFLTRDDKKSAWRLSLGRAQYGDANSYARFSASVGLCTADCGAWAVCFGWGCQPRPVG